MSVLMIKNQSGEWVGVDSIQGLPGNTPVKGVDYYTPQEVEEIKESVTPVKGVDYFDGATPAITASKLNGVTSIKVDGQTVAEITDGQDGVSPTVTASKSGNSTTIYVNGQAVALIEDGETPEITASKSDGVTSITVNGEDIAEILDGKTPVKGIDYTDGHTPVMSGGKVGDLSTIYADDEPLISVQDGKDGDKGSSGVAVSETEPTDPDVNVWIDPNGTEDPYVADVKINGASIVTDGNANIKTNASIGYDETNKVVYVNAANQSSIDNRRQQAAINPNMLDYAVKASLSDTHSTVTWTEAEKASARNRIGINLGTIRSFKTIDNIDYSRNGYLNKNGYFYEYASWHCSEKMAIPDCTKIKINRGTKFYNAQSIVFFNEGGGVTGYYPGDAGDSPIINEVIDVPVGTKYVSFGSSTNPSISSVFSADTEISLLFKDKWADKTWVCVGDSLTEENIRTTKHYFDYVSEATGIQTVNMGVSGSGYKKREENSNAFYQRISSVPSSADVVTIFGSFNDVTLISNIGTPSDTTTDTICGCINTTITNLYSVLPMVQLGIVSPTPWGAISDSDNYNTYVTALKNICTMRGIPFLDLYHCSALRPWTTEGKQNFYSKDDGGGTHPDEYGHALIAPRFKAFLEQLIL